MVIIVVFQPEAKMKQSPHKKYLTTLGAGTRRYHSTPRRLSKAPPFPPADSTSLHAIFLPRPLPNPPHRPRIQRPIRRSIRPFREEDEVVWSTVQKWELQGEWGEWEGERERKSQEGGVVDY